MSTDLRRKFFYSDYFTTVDEIWTAETIIFNLAQRGCSFEEQNCAQFLDSGSLLIVGGRIRNSSLTYEAKHPMLLSRGGLLMELIVRAVHVQCGHGGPTLSSPAQVMANRGDPHSEEDNPSVCSLTSGMYSSIAAENG